MTKEIRINRHKLIISPLKLALAFCLCIMMLFAAAYYTPQQLQLLNFSNTVIWLCTIFVVLVFELGLLAWTMQSMPHINEFYLKTFVSGKIELKYNLMSIVELTALLYISAAPVRLVR